MWEWFGMVKIPNNFATYMFSVSYLKELRHRGVKQLDNLKHGPLTTLLSLEEKNK